MSLKQPSITPCLNQVLPVNAIVHQRTRKGDPLCHCCGEAWESIEHALLQCGHAKEIWKFSPIQWDGAQEQTHNFWNWWETIMKAKNRKDGLQHIQLTVNILWQIWKDRNRYRFNEEWIPSFEVINKAVQEWQEYEHFNQQGSKESKRETRLAFREEQEQEEDPNMIAVNVNVKICSIKKKVAYSIVARSKEQIIKLIWAAAEAREGEQCMEEANAIKLALALARQRDWKKIQVQVSSASLVQKLNRKEVDDVRCAMILQNILDISVLFSSCSFKFVKAKANALATKLAKFAKDLKNPEVWEHSFPRWVLETPQFPAEQ